MTDRAIGAAASPPVVSLPELPPFSMITETATCLPAFLANPMNQACGGASGAFSAVPVLPPTSTPAI